MFEKKSQNISSQTTSQELLSNTLEGINKYNVQLTPQEIAEKKHRIKVGGFWEELGKAQVDFLIEHGLKPHHKLVDIGCGSLRGGIPFIRYLDKGNYYGLDINKSLLDAGRQEIAEAKLGNKIPNLLLDNSFNLIAFKQKFNYAVAVSLFTHLPMNYIIRSLVEVSRTLHEDGQFFATFFEAPRPAHLETITHSPGEITTNFDMDPFHYSYEEFRWMAKLAKLSVENIGDWGHPRAQKMLHFKPSKTS